MMHDTHCPPLERGNLDMSHSINIAQDLLSPSLFVQLILWIEERDSDQKVLLAERIIPTGIMARSQVTLAQSQSQSEKRVSIYDARHTLRTSGVRESGHFTFYYHKHQSLSSVTWEC